MNKYITTYLAVLLASTNVMAVEFDLSVAPGYDSNPFTLSDDKKLDSASFTETEMSLTAAKDDFRFRAKAKNEFYDSSDGDKSLIKLEGRYRTRYKISDKRTRSTIDLSYYQRDKTYVSHSTGVVGTFSGQSIADRYDYGSVVADIDTRIKLSKTKLTTLGIKLTNKDYQDFNIAGLSNLDYRQFEIYNLWQFKHEKDTEFKTHISISNRDFDDKRERDLTGSRLAGTNLRYDMYSVYFAYIKDIGNSLSSDMSFRYATRNDSGSGYYDTEEYRLKFKFKYKVNQEWNVSPGLTYIDRTFVNNVTTNPDEVTEPAKEGFSIGIKAEKDLGKMGDIPMTLFAEADYDDFDSNDANYIYDRLRFLLGVEINLGSY